MSNLKVFFFAFFMFFSSLTAEVELLESEKVRDVMSELLKVHVEYNDMSPELIERSFKIYIEKFDPYQSYLLEEEVDAYLNPSMSMLEDAYQRYQNDDLFYYEGLNRIIQKAIIRARKYRKDFRNHAEETIDLVNVDEEVVFQRESFPKNEEELKKRQRNLMIYSVKQQEEIMPEVASEDERKQMFAFYESRMREFEDLYLGENSNSETSLSESKHFFVLHTIKALANSLDAHTEYYSNEEVEGARIAIMKGFTGIGLTMQLDYRGVTVRKILANSPAMNSGEIVVGDRITQVDGNSLEDLSFKEVSSLMRGKEGTKVKLNLLSLDDKEKVIEVTREKIQRNDQITTKTIVYADGIIGVITLHSFFDDGQGNNSANAIKKAIQTFQKKGNLKGVVLDLRDNFGGFLNQAVEVAGLFISNGVIVMNKYSDGRLQYFRDLDSRIYYEGPLIVLTSKLSASAAEIVAGSLQDYGAAIVVGDDRTFGKATVQYQNLTKSEEDAYYKVTIGRYYTVSGKSPQKEGVKADIIVPSEYFDEEIGEEYLDYALTSSSENSALKDTLSDLSPMSKNVFMRYYIPSLQQRKANWSEMLPVLQKNSQVRLKKSDNFQFFLHKVHGKDISNKDEDQIQSSFYVNRKNYGLDDMQLKEALNIIKDMIQIQNEKAVKKRAFSSM